MDDIKPTSKGISLTAINNAKTAPTETIKPYLFDIKAPVLAPGVAPKDVTPPVMAMDYSPYSFVTQTYAGGGFPGFAYLAQLTTRAEFRAMASALSTELTREWIKFTSKQDDDNTTSPKIKQIEDEFIRLGVRDAFQKGAEHECYFGRAQFFLDIKGADRAKPLILDPRTIKKGSLERIVPIESIWTTPAAYDANDPTAPSFYRPFTWYMLGQTVHATRLLTIVTRPLPDLLKPAYNFAGMSLSQLAEPYVDNWLRTRQSVADLINNFSITVLSTSMDQVLQGNDDGASVIKRAQLFTATRSNLGVMLLDKDREELGQVNTPLSGLHELQAQSQEQMCSVSRMPAIILTGISPGGLNASSEGEIKVFYDWVAAQQNAFWREPLEIILKVVQLSLFGEIDSDISFDFVSLNQMTPAEIATIRKTNMETDTGYINAGVLDPSEPRERLARDTDSGYMGLDLSLEIVPPNVEPELPFGMEPEPEEVVEDPPKPALDSDFKEGDHPRAPDGKFGSGNGGGASAKIASLNTSNKQILVNAKAGYRVQMNGEDKYTLSAAGDADFPSERNLTKDQVSKRVAELEGETEEPAKPKKSFSKGGKDDRGYERAPGLKAPEREIEQTFYDAIHEHSDALIGAYHAKNGNVIDPDLVKGLNPKFADNPDLARAVHEPSSHLAKQIYSQALDRKAAAGDTSPTLFSAGGGGSGKSATRPVAEAAFGANPDGLFYDSTLSNFTSATKRIDEALKKTEGDVGIVYTNTPIETALEFNAQRSRTVSIDTLLHAHVGASDTIRELIEHYADNPRVNIAVINNQRGQSPAIGDVADVPKYNPYEIRKQLVDQASALLEDGKIDKVKYNLLIK
jgi:phage-related protein (TIGR01555 family)